MIEDRQYENEPLSTRDAWRLPALLTATAVTFGVSVSFPFMHWDDPRYVWKNPLVLHPLGQGWRELLTTPALGYPQGLTVLSYAAERALFGAEPWSFHLVNLLLHVANVAQVHALARKLALTPRLATAAAMIFALHPVVAEPVCWITGRKDLLATALLLLAAHVMMRGGRDAPFPSAWRWMSVSSLAILGMWAKPSTTIAAVVLGLYALAARPRWSTRAVATALAPLLVVGGLIVSAAGTAQSAGVDVHARTKSEALLDVVGAGALQLSHIVWPARLVSIYARIPGDPSRLLMIAGTTFMLVALAALARMRPRSAAFAGFATALVAYAPMSNVLAVNRWTADSYLYLPLVGISIGLAASLGAVIPDRLSPLAAVIVPTIGLALASNSFAQTSIWRTPEAVWRAEIARYPTSPVGYTELARTFAAEGQRDDATAAYLDLDERFPELEWDYQERALARWIQGAEDRARALLERGVALGDLSCSIVLWSALVQKRIPVASVDPVRVEQSFDHVLPGMQATATDEGVWQRSLEILEQAHLEGRADKIRSRTRATLPAASP